ncbi:E3 ubiquitin-protein ligase TTC3-like isoform X2 [Ptychodera flava]|uniref:E3 ubiquitin-protein ligase TTC3-like isoform X2 n=1 Tax=Ptychodera flava TaxID=63121 RepID=UPI00396A8B65
MATKKKSKRGTGKEFITMPDLSREAEEEQSRNNQISAELWCSKILQFPVLREKHEHVILVYTLSPLLYGKIKQPEKWLNWATNCSLFKKKTDEAALIKPLTEKEMTAVETIEMAHNLFSTKLKECGRSFLKEMLDLTSYVDLHEKMEESFKRAVVNRNFIIMTNELKDDLKSNDLTFNYVAGAMLLSLLQYCQHVRKYCLDNKNEADLFQKENKSNEKESDEVRIKGNNEFKDGRYKDACQRYTSAINRDRYNERLYCNRALTYLKTKDFAKAASDGKRAIILKAAWPKSQYRYAEGLFGMTRFHKASEANLKAISLCKENDCPPSELRDLELQRDKFYEALSEFHLVPLKPESAVKKEEDGDDDDEYTDVDDDDDDDFDGVPELVEQGPSDEECDSDGKPCADDPPPLVELETDSDSDDNYPQYPSDDNINDEEFIPLTLMNKDRHDKDLEELRRRRAMHAERENSNRDDDLREKKRQPQEFTKVPSKGFDEKEATEEDWLRKVQEDFKEASEELLQGRPRFAVKSFREAFYIMDTQLKDYEYEELDIVVSIYAYGVACLETAQVQELEIALEKFDCIILEHETIVFPLAYYGKGRVYIKQNRFSEALDPLRNGLLILQRQVHQHGVVRWPGTKHIIEESDTKKMKEAFEINIEICKSPPQPDAVCRLHDPSSNTKIDIYFSDPDFKGFVRTQCHEHCTLEFHPSCWKKIKHENVEKAQDKDYLGERCFTPDCDAVIVYIVIFSQDGLKRTEFTGEKPERKPKNAAAKAVKVKAYSEKKLEKLKRKKEIKVEKKRLAKENRNKQNNDDNDDDANILESELLLGASNANRPTSLPLSSVSNNVINSSSNSPGTPDSQNQLTPFEIGYVLKKEEIEGDQALGAHAKPVKTKSKKKKQKNVQTLDLFLGKKPGDVDLEDEDGSRQRSFNMLDENSPFAVPEQLLTEAAMFERIRANIAPVIAPPPMTEEERKAEEQLRDSLFSYFAQILEKHGPLQVEDPVLVSGFYEIFPPEAHKLVTRWGNLSNFLLQSLQFAMVDDMVCLLKDSVRCRELVRQKSGTPNPDGKSNLKPLNGKAPSASVENTQGAAFINQSANLSSENFPNLSAVHAANKGSNGKRTSRSNNSNHSTSNQSMNSAINPKIDVKTSNFPTLDKLSDIVFDGRKGNSKEAISELSSFEAIGNSFRESKGHADTMPEFALTKGSNGSVPYQNVAAAELPIGNISLQQRASNHLTMSTSHLKYNASEDMNRLDRCDSGIHEETPNPAEDKIPNFSLSVASHRAENNSIPEECSEWTGGVSDISDLHLSMLTSGDSFRHSYPQTGKRSKRDFSVQVVFNPYVKSIAVNTDGTALYKPKQFDKLSRENHISR